MNDDIWDFKTFQEEQKLPGALNFEFPWNVIQEVSGRTVWFFKCWRLIILQEPIKICLLLCSTILDNVIQAKQKKILVSWQWQFF